MNGARKYAQVIPTGQYGRLYVVSGSHARGKTFHVYVLPEGVKAIPNGPNNPPLNKDAVEVFGILGGNPGWTEHYGWIHEGKWQDDLETMFTNAKAMMESQAARKAELETRNGDERAEREAALLATY